MKYKHIVWDWNGTLIDDAWLCHELCDIQFKAHGHPGISFETYTLEAFHPFWEFYRKMGVDISIEEFRALSHQFHEDYERRRHECSLRQGATETLSQLSEYGLDHTILSAHPHPMLVQAVELFEIGHHFEELIGQDDKLGHGKVVPGQEWFKRSGLNQSEVIVIGDTDHDYEVAQAIGADCILLSGGIQHRGRLVKLGIPICDDISQVVELLSKT